MFTRGLYARLNTDFTFAPNWCHLFSDASERLSNSNVAANIT